MLIPFAIYVSFSRQATLIFNMEQNKLFGWAIRRCFLSKEQVDKGYLQVLRAGVGEAEEANAEWQWQGRLRRLKDHVNEVMQHV